MRIIHLSDIHLSKDNYLEFINDYQDALIEDLRNYNVSKKIDIILITGDLVDKGGHSLYQIPLYSDKVKYPNPYDIFEEIFINPIIENLNFNKENFLFIPGNHDIDESTILLKEEFDLIKNINKDNINDYLNENQNNDLTYSKRIKNFKEFENKFHLTNEKYLTTNNQSTYYYNFNGKNVGFILINDSWRCKSIKLQNENDKMFFGMQQLYDGLNQLKTNDTKINIVLFHHSIENFLEKDDIEGFLTRKGVDFMLYGHYHTDKSQQFHSSSGSCHVFRGKASLSNPSETHKDYIPGYQVIDLDTITYKIIQIDYRTFSSKPVSKKFVSDNSVYENGVNKNQSNSNNGFVFYRSNKEDKQRIEYSLLNKEDFQS